jgi:hypothetical protein
LEIHQHYQKICLKFKHGLLPLEAEYPLVVVEVAIAPEVVAEAADRPRQTPQTRPHLKMKERLVR